MPLTYGPDISYGGLSYGPDLTTGSNLTYGPDIVHVPSTGTGPPGTLVPPADSAVEYEGEALIRETIRDILYDLSIFDLVWVGSRLDFSNKPSVVKAVSVQSISTRLVKGFDAGKKQPRIYKTQMKICVYANHPNTETRDAIATMLLDPVRDALNNESIAGLTFPELTILDSWEWHGDARTTTTPAKPDISPPVREVEAMLCFDWSENF